MITAVAGAAAQVFGASGPTDDQPFLLSSTFPGLPCDESSRIDVARRSLPFEAVVMPAAGRKLDLARALEAARAHDQPGLNLQQELFEEYAAQAQARAARCVLSGLGGDELCIDWHYERDLLRAAGVRGFPGALRRIAELEGTGLRGALSLIAGRLRSRIRRSRQRQYPWSSHSARIRWQVLQDPKGQAARRWWDEELQARGLALASPFLDRRLWELVLGSDRWLPRSFDTGHYKPLIADAMREFVPEELTRAYWKASFDEYNRGVLRRSMPELCAVLFDSGTWESEAFIRRSRAEELAASIRGDRKGKPPDPIVQDVFPRVVALELWLRQRKSSLRP